MKRRKWPALLLSAALFTSGVSPARAETVKVPAGTPVTLSLLHSVSSRTDVAGKVVHFQVASDVVVNGKVAIPAGSKAIGKLAMAVPANFVGIPGSLIVEAQKVTTPSGVDIPVSERTQVEGRSYFIPSLVCGLFCLIPLLIKGTDITMAQGDTMVATVLSTTEVPAK
jgi:hypothetical protein